MDGKEILEQVKSNRAKLDSCIGHKFVGDTGKVFHKFKCSNCGGEVDAVAKSWYERGQAHERHNNGVVYDVKLKLASGKIACCSQLCTVDCPGFYKCADVMVKVVR